MPQGDPGYVDEAFEYTGRWFDSATGLQNNQNRWYSPSLGRWVSEDPIGFSGGDANLYRYVGNQPTEFVDPNGLDPVPGGRGYGGSHDQVLPIDPRIAIQHQQEQIEMALHPSLPPGCPLTPAQKNALAPYIPPVDLNNARIHVGEMPWYAFGWVDGMTIGNDIYIRNPNECFNTPQGLALLGHELVHVGQYRNGMTQIGYLWNSRHGYDNNPYEREAYDKQREIENGLH